MTDLSDVHRSKNDGKTDPHKKAVMPAVGIIFMRGNHLWIDSTPVKDAVDYGLLKTHEKGHPDFWEELQNRGSVPRFEEYDEIPRGRANFDTRKNTWYLFLDRCISERPKIVSRIFEALHLPPEPTTKIDGDSHYVCPGCRPRARAEVEDDEDW